MGKKRPRPRRSFTAEFKSEIVELCQRGDRTIGQVAKEFDLTETAVREWVKQAPYSFALADSRSVSSTARALSDMLNATRRELRAVISTKPGLHRYLR